MAIQAIFYDEWGRVTGRTQETSGETETRTHVAAQGTKQVTTELKGTQRRPAARLFSRHLDEKWS